MPSLPRDLTRSLSHQVAVAGSVLTSTLDLWRGTSLVAQAAAPAKRLRLYDIEASPGCRAVRDALTALGLDAEIYPCPRGGERFRQQAVAVGGKMQFPLLVDPNTDSVLYESAAIVDYLFATYGKQPTPAYYQQNRLRPLLGGAAMLVRGLRGLDYRPAARPKKLLELWSFESSPYSRLVRERLCELALPYVLHNLGKEQTADLGPASFRLQRLSRLGGSYKPKPGGKRARVLALRGRVQVPYLEDPNTGVKLYESAAIIDYLERQYAR